MKEDLYHHKKRYNNWKESASQKGFIQECLSEPNSKLLVKYIFDMELGLNVSIKNKKGARGSYWAKPQMGKTLKILTLERFQ